MRLSEIIRSIHLVQLHEYSVMYCVFIVRLKCFCYVVIFNVRCFRLIS